MDLGFLRRVEQRFASRTPAKLDYGLLLAMLRAHQSASATARAEALCGVREGAGTHETLVALLLGDPDWRDAAAARKGCFNAALAAASTGRQPI